MDTNPFINLTFRTHAFKFVLDKGHALPLFLQNITNECSDFGRTLVYRIRSYFRAFCRIGRCGSGIVPLQVFSCNDLLRTKGS